METGIVPWVIANMDIILQDLGTEKDMKGHGNRDMTQGLGV